MTIKSMQGLLNGILDRLFGLRMQPSADARLEKCRMRLISQLQIDCVIDVGANRGQFGLRVRKSGYPGKLVSFEPSPAFRELSLLADVDDFWSIHNVALSDEQTMSSLHLASNGFLSSSLLKPDRVIREFGMDFSESISVQVNRCDDFHKEFGTRNYMKLDVQGNELSVLEGSHMTLCNTQVIEFESALVPLYQNERTFMDIYGFLIARNFIPVMFTPTHWDKSGSLISLDSIFVRNSS